MEPTLRPEAQTVLEALRSHPETADIAEARVAQANTPGLLPGADAPTVPDVVAGIATLARHVAMGTGLSAGQEWTADAKKRRIHGYATTEGKKRRERAAEDERRPRAQGGPGGAPGQGAGDPTDAEIEAYQTQMAAQPKGPMFSRQLRAVPS